MHSFFRKLQAIIIIILLFAITGSVFSAIGVHIKKSNTLDEEPTPYWEEMPANTNLNFKYFGYYHFSDAVDEVAAMGNANLAKVDAEDIEEIASLARNNFRILIMIRHIFFESGDTPEDWAARWENAKLELAPYMDNIIGFYVDEPMWTGKTIEAFHHACKTVRADYPDKRMMAMVCWWSVVMPEMISDADPKEYFRYCTDLGYDLYRTWDKDAVLADVALFESTIAVYGQAIWMSPKGFYVSNQTKNINWMYENLDLKHGDDIVNWIKGAYEIAVNNHRIVGFLTFVYGNEGTGEGYDHWLSQYFDTDGEFYREDIRELYIQIGKAVIANDK